jgi:hypothetical protein
LTTRPNAVDVRQVRSARFRFALFFALGAIGCASSVPPAATAPVNPPAPTHQPVSELDALEHDFDAAATRLESQLEKKQRAPVAQERSEADDKPAPPPPPPPPPQRKAPSATEESGAERDSGGTQLTGQVGSPCDVACRAFGSMKRSAIKICELAGSTNERCTRARTRLAEAEKRIGNAGCECKKRENEKLMSAL